MGIRLDKRGGTGFDEELVVYDFCGFETDCLLDCFDGEIYLVLEWLARDVWADGHVGMSNPSIESALVQCSRLFCSLMPGLVIGQGVIFLRPVCCSIHEDNAIVPLVSEPGPRPSLLIQHSLVRLPRHICRTVRNPSIRQYQARRLAHLSQPSDIILKVHLELYDPCLELYDVLGVVFPEIAHTAT